MAEKEYIERSAVVAMLHHFEDWICPPERVPLQVVDGIRQRVSEIPAADVAPVVHGEWMLRHVGHGHYWECSVCRTNPCIYVTENTKFCPNCGAKMDGKTKEEKQ